MKFSVSNREMNEIKIFLYNENAWKQSPANVLIFNFSVLTQETSHGISRCVLENFTNKKIVPLRIKEINGEIKRDFSKVNKL